MRLALRSTALANSSPPFRVACSRTPPPCPRFAVRRCRSPRRWESRGCLPRAARYQAARSATRGRETLRDFSAHPGWRIAEDRGGRREKGGPRRRRCRALDSNASGALASKRRPPLHRQAGRRLRAVSSVRASLGLTPPCAPSSGCAFGYQTDAGKAALMIATKR